MNKRIFDIDFNKLLLWLVPVWFRNAVVMQWLAALVGPVVSLYQIFLRFRTQKLYELMITPQVCYLERLLNDKYDFIGRRIRIIDAQDKPPLYIYLEDELKPVPLYLHIEEKPKRFIYTDGEASDIKDDFIIKVPASIVFNNNEMLQLVKGYRLAAMQPKIQRV